MLGGVLLCKGKTAKQMHCLAVFMLIIQQGFPVPQG